MNPSRIDSQIFRWLGGALLVVIALSAGILSFLHLDSRSTTDRQMERPEGLLWPQTRALPLDGLQDHNGQPFTHADLEGQWSLIFFGYTLCPDICPMTLATLHQTNRLLAQQSAPNSTSTPRIVLVSVDPARDTPDRLRDYLDFFNTSFQSLGQPTLGVTGNHPDLQRMTQAMGAVYMLENPDDQGHYLVHHTASLFLISPQGQLVGILTSPHAPAELAQRIQAMVRFVEKHS
jgi:protein SCO1/2